MAGSFSLSSDAVFAIQEDLSGAIWVGTDGGGLNRFDKRTGKFRHYQLDSETPKSLSSNRIKALTLDKKGTLWIATLGGGLNKFDAESNEFNRYVNDLENPGSLSSNAVTCILEGVQVQLVSAQAALLAGDPERALRSMKTVSVFSGSGHFLWG